MVTGEFLACSDFLAAYAIKVARMWNVTNGQLRATLEGHNDTVITAVFSPEAGRDETAWGASFGYTSEIAELPPK